jgi:hypothetical protein
MEQSQRRKKMVKERQLCIHLTEAQKYFVSLSGTVNYYSRVCMDRGRGGVCTAVTYCCGGCCIKECLEVRRSKLVGHRCEGTCAVKLDAIA